MSRINTNVQSLIAQRVLSNNNLTLNQSLERLSTGLRINRGKDDPAGLIASENLRSEKSSLNAAISNSERADQVANIAEGGLQEVSGLLTELQGLVTSSANTAGLSPDERSANQLQIDSILQTIDRIASATSFQGKKLLNGSLGYQTSAMHTSAIAQATIWNASRVGNNVLSVDVDVVASAQYADDGDLHRRGGQDHVDVIDSVESCGLQSVVLGQIGAPVVVAATPAGDLPPTA